MIYKRNCKVKYLVIYVVQSKKEEIDKNLKNFKIRDGKNRRYISFRGLDSDNRLAYLYLCNLNNI